ncbi:MAG: carboxymuconolactone decarboxylase family protein [Sulfurimonas sp.]|nr:carboxymuconolactone decarboxylase family protein [Sulfurimonas sp.]
MLCAFGGRFERYAQVAVIVSIQNSCAYCVDAHMMMLDSMGIDAGNIENNLDALGLNEKEKLLFNLAREINKNSTKVEDKLFETLRLNNVDIEEILEIIGVVELFVGYNLFLNAMDIPGGNL